MKKYSVTAAAEELMLDAAELQEIYEVFFSDAQDLLAVCKQGIIEKNNTVLAKALHNLKGAANNLRMQEIGNEAAELEKLVAMGKDVQVEPNLSGLYSKIAAMQEDINRFYSSY